MVTQEAIRQVLHTVNDPELPISIVDLGIVEGVRIEPGPAEGGGQGASVFIDLLPTFVGCAALHVIEEEVRRRVGALSGVGQVAIHFQFDTPWTVDRISAAGRETLKKHGVTVPLQIGPAETPPPCPFCSSSAVHLESPFGPTRCRMIYYCASCHNSFEHLKKLENASSLLQIDPMRGTPK